MADLELADKASNNAPPEEEGGLAEIPGQTVKENRQYRKEKLT